MARKLSDIRASVRDVLRDEFVEGVDWLKNIIILKWHQWYYDRMVKAVELGYFDSCFRGEYEI